MRHAQLPRYLRTKLRTYFALRFPGHRAFDEEHILSQLSPPLTHEVCACFLPPRLTHTHCPHSHDNSHCLHLCICAAPFSRRPVHHRVYMWYRCASKSVVTC